MIHVANIISDIEVSNMMLDPTISVTMLLVFCWYIVKISGTVSDTVSHQLKPIPILQFKTLLWAYQGNKFEKRRASYCLETQNKKQSSIVLFIMDMMVDFLIIWIEYTIFTSVKH